MSRKSTHEELLAASHAVEQELNVVKALKRLSIGNSLNYDPDLPPDESEFVDLNYIDVHRSPTSSSTSSSSSSIAAKHSSLCEEQSDDDDSAADNFEHFNRNSNNNNDDDHSSYDAENVILDSNKLMWVPATAHPKLAPDNFRKYVQETVQEITSKLDKSKTRSNRSSLSSEYTQNISTLSSSSSRPHRSSSQPSLKELSAELQNLSHLAGMDSTDAVTLARTLSSSSLGFTELEMELYGKSTDLPLSRSNSLTAHQASRLRNQAPVPSSMTTLKPAIDDDLPIPTSEGNGLKRARWTTYRKSGGPKMLRERRKQTRQVSAPSLTNKELPEIPIHSSVSPSSSSITTPSSRLPPLPNTPNIGTQSAIPLQAFSSSPTSPLPLQSSKHSGWNWLGHKEKRSPMEHVRDRHGPVEDHSASPSPSSSSSSLSSEKEPPSSPSSPPVPPQASSPYRERKGSISNIFRFRSKSVDKYDSAVESNSKTIMELKAVFHHHSSRIKENSLPESPPESEEGVEAQARVTKPLETPKEDLHITSRHHRYTFEAQKVIPRAPLPAQPNHQDHSASALQQQQLMQRQLQHRKKHGKHDVQGGHNHNDGRERQLVKQLDKQVDNQSLLPSLVNAQQRQQQQQQQQQQQHQRQQKSQPHHDLNHAEIQESSEEQPSRSLTSSEPFAEPSVESSTEALKQSLKLAHRNAKPNQPLEMRDSAFGFPLPPVSKSTLIMLDYRFPIHVERAVYRLSHLKLADPKRPLYQQVLLSNFMYAYLNLVNHTLYLQQQQQDQMFPIDHQQEALGAGYEDGTLCETVDLEKPSDETYDESRHIEEMYGRDSILN
ncbi:hypothetical protein FOA43_002718 [Brettanomyces nanus]|uniref:Protein Zds1 C-terminal domain-containing protein n=1 Tax=Eeniella nana TaxID=13502 RepID=A0A875S4S0_EENNA|nr:uncharacterized protein FOA43_002718 [Brettanomyces nanus]QPG75365.1 hypothetical protein FOA43_002718 [Brettanomyces nanus]